MDFRKKREEDALRLLGAAQRALQLEIKRKQDLLDALNRSLLRRELLGEIPTGPNEFHVEQDFIGGTKQRIIQADHAISRAHRGVEKALRVYLLSRRQVRVLELLYDRDFAAYKHEARRRENREADDLNIMRRRLQEEVA